jgi:hypothetical protein
VASGAKGPGRLGVLPVAGNGECLKGMRPDPRDDLGNRAGDGEMDVVRCVWRAKARHRLGSRSALGCKLVTAESAPIPGEVYGNQGWAGWQRSCEQRQALGPEEPGSAGVPGSGSAAVR